MSRAGNGRGEWGDVNCGRSGGAEFAVDGYCLQLLPEARERRGRRVGTTTANNGQLRQTIANGLAFGFRSCTDLRNRPSGVFGDEGVFVGGGEL